MVSLVTSRYCQLTRRRTVGDGLPPVQPDNMVCVCVGLHHPLDDVIFSLLLINSNNGNEHLEETVLYAFTTSPHIHPTHLQ